MRQFEQVFVKQVSKKSADEQKRLSRGIYRTKYLIYQENYLRKNSRQKIPISFLKQSENIQIYKRLRQQF
ncbi:hypothetical protein [Desulfofarcimen acetoxidans]|uniref:hypothetical protein n=1 Tax=Desulfofarcimen acetoxidans TaxID=58138 RepID=UPI00019E565B|nr:hypothetical protein [Desulfofarcimen acetoxidans]